MKNRIQAALLALALSACLGGGQWPEELAPTNGSGRRIRGVTQFQTIYEWQRSGWSRIDDGVMSWPVYVAITDDDSACVISASVWALANAGDRLVCSPWRLRRP
jgi:hypothetical protein